MILAWRALRALRDLRLIEGNGGRCCVVEGQGGRRCLLEPCHGEAGVVCWRLVEAALVEARRVCWSAVTNSSSAVMRH